MEVKILKFNVHIFEKIISNFYNVSKFQLIVWNFLEIVWKGKHTSITPIKTTKKGLISCATDHY